MILSEFKRRLKKLNKDLYVRDDEVTKMDGLKHSGIYLKMTKQSGLSYGSSNYLDDKRNAYFTALERGELDKYLGGICIEWLPEFDVFNKEYTKIAVPGWRTAVLRLVANKVTTLDRARKVFNCPSLGEADYDRMTFFERIKFVKKRDEE